MVSGGGGGGSAQQGIKRASEAGRKGVSDTCAYVIVRRQANVVVRKQFIDCCVGI